MRINVAHVAGNGFGRRFEGFDFVGLACPPGGRDDAAAGTETPLAVEIVALPGKPGRSPAGFLGRLRKRQRYGYLVDTEQQLVDQQACRPRLAVIVDHVKSVLSRQRLDEPPVTPAEVVPAFERQEPIAAFPEHGVPRLDEGQHVFEERGFSFRPGFELAEIRHRFGAVGQRESGEEDGDNGRPCGGSVQRLQLELRHGVLGQSSIK